MDIQQQSTGLFKQSGTHKADQLNPLLHFKLKVKISHNAGSQLSQTQVQDSS